MSDDNKTSGIPASIHQSFETGADSIIFQPLLDHIQNGVAHCRMLYEEGQPSDFIYLYTNPAFEQLTGLKQITGKRVTEVIPGIRESDPELFNIYGSVAAGNGPVKFESYLKALDMWFSVSVYSPKHEHFVAIFDVITERKLTEEKLKQSEETYRALFETVVHGVVFQDKEGRIISANSAAERILGLSLDQMQGRTSMDPQWGAIHEDGSPFPGDSHPTMVAIQTGKPVNDVVMGIKNPMIERPVWIKVYATPVFKKGTEEVDYAYSIIENITDRKLNEELVREYSARLKRILDNLFAYVALLDLNGVVEEVNKAPLERAGYRREDVIGQYFYDAPWWNYNDEVRTQLIAAINAAKRGVSSRYDVVVKMSDDFVPIDFQITPILDNTGQIIGLLPTAVDITERKQSELKSQFLASIIQSSEDAILSKDLKGIITSWNSGCQRLFGYTAEEMVGQSLLKLFPPDRVDEEQFIMLEISSGHRIDHFETVRLGKNGLPIDVSVTMSPIFDQAGKVIGASKIARNITERKLAEEKLRLSSSVFAHAWEGILITTTDGTIVDTNDAFSRITGYSRDEVLGKNPRILSSGLHNQAFFADLWDSLIKKEHWYGEVWNRRKSGEMYAIVETISVVNDAQGIPGHYVAMLTDITRLKEHENELEHIAHYDPLTNLPNRILLADRMRQGITQVRRRNQSMAVVFLDLDGFKAINDKNGHEAGDRLLMAIASRMVQALREGDTFARIGGDEFVAVLLDLDNEDTAVQLLNRLLAAAFEPVQLADINLQVTASLGVAFYPQQEDIDADQLLRQADQAMYQAKLAGKNRYHVYDAALDHSIRTRNESLDRFRVAMIELEFILYYQPKVNMRTGAIIGAEALIRWNQPGKGLLSPALFLPEIEDHPLAIELGEWVIDTALTQVQLWRSQGLDIQVSVNVGARQLQQSNFVTRLCEILAAHPDIMPSYLELEVLETSALEDIAKASLLIENCRKLGVSFALDDFGTGYSSLTYLKRLAVNVLKIDQSFVRDMLDDSDDLAIIEAVVGLGRTFRRQVIAEGVETIEHGTLLLQLGCELAQGYGIARPMPADQLLRWAMTWRPDPAWANQQLR